MTETGRVRSGSGPLRKAAAVGYGVRFGRCRALCGVLLLPVAGCAWTRGAERSLRIAARVQVGADGMIELRGGRLRERDGLVVKIADFALDATEVTVNEYRRCVAAGACRVDAARSTRGCNLARMYVEEHPINCVSVEEAEAYCDWRGARLPTRAEWQWAVQGRGQARRYVWGDHPRRRGWGEFEPFVCGEYQVEHPPRTATCTVGRHDRSRDGIADLGGNVSEWVREGPDEAYAVGRSFDYPFVDTEKYVGRRRRQYIEAQDTIVRTLEDDRAEDVRTADSRVGFRCARSLGEGG
jgi:formylglycine-generating enzyme required for sulfatase activity